MVIYNPAIDNDILKDRIKSFGPNYTFWGNHWFIKTTCTTKDVYEKLSSNEFEAAAILVVELSQNALNYYGRMNTSLWDWLKNK